MPTQSEVNIRVLIDRIQLKCGTEKAVSEGGAKVDDLRAWAKSLGMGDEFDAALAGLKSAGIVESTQRIYDVHFRRHYRELTGIEEPLPEAIKLTANAMNKGLTRTRIWGFPNHVRR